MNIKTNLAHKSNYGDARALSQIEYLVIHYTGNDGDTDENNGKYFDRTVTKTSAHYFVDDDSVTQSVPDNYIAYHCGAKTYKHRACRNKNSIGIEICDDVKNGSIYPSAKTIANVLELTESLMKKYNIPKEKVIRHYDVTGKLCPAYWSGTAAKDKLWLSEFHDKLPDTVTSTVKKPTTSTETIKVDGARAFDKRYAKTYTVKANGGLRLRKGASTSKGIIKTLANGSKFTCYGYYTNNSGTIWLYGVDSKGVKGFCSKAYLV